MTAVKRYANGTNQYHMCGDVTSRLLFAAPPEVYVWTRNANVDTNIILMCLATGFSSTDTVLQIKRGDRVLTERDGVQSSGVRPNHDDTFQRQHWVEVLKSDEARYSCEVTHAPSGHQVQKVWGKKLLL